MVHVMDADIGGEPTQGSPQNVIRAAERGLAGVPPLSADPTVGRWCKSDVFNRILNRLANHRRGSRPDPQPNNNHAVAEWHFTTDDARFKLKTLYPSL